MKHRQIHEKDSTIDGYRVQIFMELGNFALEHAENMKAEFQEKYPDMPVHLVFKQPYYRLRIGDFRTRLEAEHLYQQIKKEYKNAFVTADRIDLPYNPLCSGCLDIEAQNDNSYLLDSLLFEEMPADTIFYDLNEELFYDE